MLVILDEAAIPLARGAWVAHAINVERRRQVCNRKLAEVVRTGSPGGSREARSRTLPPVALIGADR